MIVYRKYTIRTKQQKPSEKPQKQRIWDCVDLCGF